ncbi:MAG: hypothetical protein FJ100_09140 [Deltaproteobacteria bacterium]|nr:hypothetical protein [Deltaproteobacteria bacterium]
MVARLQYLVFVLACGVAGLASEGRALPRLLHQAPAEAAADKPLELDFAVTETTDMSGATLFWKPLQDGNWRKAAIELSSTGVWRATVPGDAMDDPGVAYYVVAHGRDGSELAQFASATEPHPVYVRGSAQRTNEAVALRERGGRRSDLRVGGEYVDYRVIGVQAGSPDFGPRYRDFQFAYRYWVLKGVEYIEAGIGTLRGRASTFQPGIETGVGTGFDRGWAEIGLAPLQFVGLGARLTLGGDEETFRIGLAGLLRLGMAERSRLQLEAGYISGVGYKVVTGFHVQTIAKVPLALEIILTNEPNQSRETAERGRLKIGYELTPGAIAHLLLSYQALRGAEHGFGAGAELAFRF